MKSELTHQQQFTQVHRWARSAIGAISDAYEIVTVWKTPQGMPMRICDNIKYKD